MNPKRPPTLQEAPHGLCTCCLACRHWLPPSKQQPRELVQRPCMEPRSRNARNTNSSSGAHGAQGRSERARMQTSNACSHLHSNPALAHSVEKWARVPIKCSLRLPLWRSLPLSQVDLLSRVLAGAHQPRLPPVYPTG